MRRNIYKGTLRNRLATGCAPLVTFWNNAGTWSRAPGKQFGVLDRWRDRHTRPAGWSDTLRIRPVRWRKWNRIRIDLAGLAEPIHRKKSEPFSGPLTPDTWWGLWCVKNTGDQTARAAFNRTRLTATLLLFQLNCPTSAMTEWHKQKRPKSPNTIPTPWINWQIPSVIGM